MTPDARPDPIQDAREPPALAAWDAIERGETDRTLTGWAAARKVRP